MSKIKSAFLILLGKPVIYGVTFYIPKDKKYISVEAVTIDTCTFIEAENSKSHTIIPPYGFSKKVDLEKYEVKKS